MQIYKALKKWDISWFEIAAQNCMVNQHSAKTFELPNTNVMSALLDCQIMNIYCIMKMWWHLEESHLTLSSRASVSPLPTNAFCSKECILKDSGRNVIRSRHCLSAGVISDWFLDSGEYRHKRLQSRLNSWRITSTLTITVSCLTVTLFILKSNDALFKIGFFSS